MEKLVLFSLGAIGVIALIIAIALLLTIPVWLLWNMVVPQVFGLKAITFIQALQLSLLSSLLFKSWSSSSSK